MQEQEGAAVDTAAESDNSGSPADLAQIADLVKSTVAEALAPLNEEIQAAKKNKTERRNHKLAEDVKAREAEIAKLRSELDRLSPDTVEAKEAHFERLKEDYLKQQKEFQEFRGEFDRQKAALRRKELDELVLRDVAPEHREHALDLMEGTLSRQKIDIDNEDLADVAEKLRGRIQPLLSVPQRKTTGEGSPVDRQPETPADPNKVDWTSYKSWEEVPDQLKAHVPLDVFKKLVKPTGGSGGLRI